MSLESALRFEADSQQKASHLRKAYENQIERIKYDELMSDRQNVVRLYKFNDFWDDLILDLSALEKKAEKKEGEKPSSKDVNFEKNINLRAEWNENLEEASWKKRIRNEHGIIKSELRMAAKAALAVRRVALKQLLEQELEKYEKELSLQGKTFFKQRI